jgi:hypothetical protein
MAQLNLDVNGQTYPIRDLSFICSSSYGNQCYSAICPGGSFSLAQWWTTLVLYKTQVNTALVAIASVPANQLGAAQKIALIQDIIEHHSTGLILWEGWLTSNQQWNTGTAGNCSQGIEGPYEIAYQNLLNNLLTSITSLYDLILLNVVDVNDISEETAETNTLIADANKAISDAQKALEEAKMAEFQRKMWTYLIPAIVVIIVLFLLRKRATA